MPENTKRILCIASNPDDTEQLNLDEEFSIIKDILNNHDNAHDYEGKFIQTGSYQDLQLEVIDFKPHIVHFSGHGLENGLLFHDSEGDALPVPTTQLTGLFKIATGQNIAVECILINACDSYQTAEAVSELIPQVIGMNAPVRDNDAIEFASGFYNGLIRNFDYLQAFMLGVNSIMSDLKVDQLRTLIAPASNIPKELNAASNIPVIFPKSLRYGISANQEKIEELVAELENPNTDIPRRLEIGNELRILGDTRKGVSLDEEGLPDIQWLEIPSGEYLLGNGERFETDGFFVSQYLVTNQQYESFAESEDFHKADYWEGMKKLNSPKNSWNKKNQPKSGISFFEAVAFTRWLSDKQDADIRLPTMQQWEIAAKGHSDQEYPWGDDFHPTLANTDDDNFATNPEQPTFVGMYPAGVSPFGVHDMCGNVWEWCLNHSDEPAETDIDDSDSERVIRGGSFFRTPENARISYINSTSPTDIENYYIGIRLVRKV